MAILTKNERKSIINVQNCMQGVRTVNGTANTYYFQRNLLGDVVAIYDTSGNLVVKYLYDAWGRCLITSDTSNCNIATINSFRYRGYYYDEEIAMYYLQSRYYDPMVGRFLNIDGSITWDVEKSVYTTNLFHYCENDPVNQIDVTGKTVLKIVLRAIIGAIFGASMQYLSDVLQNLLNCLIDNKQVTKNIWKSCSGIGDYISTIVTGACDATLKIGMWKSIGISMAATLVAHVANFVSGKRFNFQALIKDLVWNVLLGIVSNTIAKKFKPKQGKQLNKYIRERFKVKGTNEYKRLWNLLCECVEWNVYVISTFVNSLRSACRRILDFVEVILWDCIIKAFDQVF